MQRPSAARPAVLGPALVALAALALHAACGGRYGVFRDELYFVVCGERLAWGYVDQPPGIAAVAALAHGLFGTWVPGLRLLPWLASAATVYATGRLAARLGAGAFGATLAALGVAAAPVLLALGHYLTMNAFEPLAVVALASTLLRLARGEDPRLWVAAAGIAGLGVLFKYTSALVALCLLAALLLFPERRALRTRWALVAAGFGLLLVLPNLAWQASHGFPFLELVRNGQLYKNAPLAPAGFLLGLATEPNPVGALVWVAGVAWLLSRAAGPARFLGAGALLYVVLLLATKGKPYYAAPVLPILFAGGGAAWERVRPRAVRAAFPAALAVSGVALAPLLVPLLPVETVVRYQAALGHRPAPLERSALGPLPQILADQFGLAEIAAAVRDVYLSLPPHERRTAGIYAQNYGEAAAIDVLAAGAGLPRATSGHNTYFLWGPPRAADPLLVVGDEDEDCGDGAWRMRTLGARRPADSPWAMPYERRRSVWICRGVERPIEALWPLLRHYE
jgi:4-amino-4-deoxy-L-arabinose transferase-like glycosyltransferase